MSKSHKSGLRFGRRVSRLQASNAWWFLTDAIEDRRMKGIPFPTKIARKRAVAIIKEFMFDQGLSRDKKWKSMKHFLHFFAKQY